MIIDAHMHYADDHPDFIALLGRYDLKFLNICVVNPPEMNWREDANLYCDVTKRFPARFAWCTTFSLPDFIDPNWHDNAISLLNVDFADGAIACKVWKNVGMELRKPDGSFVLPDDPIFDPIYEHLISRNIPLLTHIAEPIACWSPPSADIPHMGYYRDNPQWHMYNRPEYPNHKTLMDARDHLVAKHPRLKVIGAHLASLEFDVDEVAARLNKYPNFAVDISARLIDLAIQPSGKVRDFFLRYPDRILYGTDKVMRTRPSAMSSDDRSITLKQLGEVFDNHFAYFNDGLDMTVPDRQTQHRTIGLKLPAEVLQQFYVENARTWYPGL